MDPDRFASFARALTEPRLRRSLARTLAALALGGVAGVAGGADAEARPCKRCRSQPKAAACDGAICGLRADNCRRAVKCGTCPSGLNCLSNGGCGIGCFEDTRCSGDCNCYIAAEGNGYCSTTQNLESVCTTTDDCPPGRVCLPTSGGNSLCARLCVT